MPPSSREPPSEERLEPKREVKEPSKEGEEEVPEPQEKGEQEEGRERSRRAAAVKATQTLQANEAVSDPTFTLPAHHEDGARPGGAGGGTEQDHSDSCGYSQEMDQVLYALNLFGPQPCVVWAIINLIL